MKKSTDIPYIFLPTTPMSNTEDYHNGYDARAAQKYEAYWKPLTKQSLETYKTKLCIAGLILVFTTQYVLIVLHMPYLWLALCFLATFIWVPGLIKCHFTPRTKAERWQYVYDLAKRQRPLEKTEKEQIEGAVFRCQLSEMGSGSEKG